MADENGAPRRLTLDDPVEEGIIEQLGQLQDSWMSLAERNTHLDQEKIHILAALKRIDDEKGKIFERALIERGLSPVLAVEIDAKSRKLKVLQDAPPEP